MRGHGNIIVKFPRRYLYYGSTWLNKYQKGKNLSSVLNGMWVRIWKHTRVLWEIRGHRFKLWDVLAIMRKNNKLFQFENKTGSNIRLQEKNKVVVNNLDFKLYEGINFDTKIRINLHNPKSCFISTMQKFCCFFFRMIFLLWLIIHNQVICLANKQACHYIFTSWGAFHNYRSHLTLIARLYLTSLVVSLHL